MLGVAEYVAGRTTSNDTALIKEDDGISDLGGKAHLVSHHHHGHAFKSELFHHGQYLANQFRVEC